MNRESEENLSEFFRSVAQRPPRKAQHHIASFMAVYDQVLSEDGDVEFKTDNRGLFEYSLESIPEAGWKVRNIPLIFTTAPWPREM